MAPLRSHSAYAPNRNAKSAPRDLEMICAETEPAAQQSAGLAQRSKAAGLAIQPSVGPWPPSARFRLRTTAGTRSAPGATPIRLSVGNGGEAASRPRPTAVGLLRTASSRATRLVVSVSPNTCQTAGPITPDLSPAYGSMLLMLPQPDSRGSSYESRSVNGRSTGLAPLMVGHTRCYGRRGRKQTAEGLGLRKGTPWLNGSIAEPRSSAWPPPVR